jgi:hypothetical protein
VILWLKVGILGAGEAGAILGYVGEFAVAYDAGLWVVATELL